MQDNDCYHDSQIVNSSELKSFSCYATEVT